MIKGIHHKGVSIFILFILAGSKIVTQKGRIGINTLALHAADPSSIPDTT